MSCTSYNDTLLNTYTKDLGDDILLDGSDIARSRYIEKIKTELYNTMITNSLIENYKDCIKNTASSDTGKIIGIVIGVLILLGIIAGFYMYYYKKSNKEELELNTSHHSTPVYVYGMLKNVNMDAENPIKLRSNTKSNLDLDKKRILKIIKKSISEKI